MLTYGNHLGLYSEEIDLERQPGRQLPAGLHAPRAHRGGGESRSADGASEGRRLRTEPSRGPASGLRRMLVPLALAQFICSFAGSNMNVMITDISKDLDTTVQGVQIAITVFLLVMAALMIPGGKLTDRWGRKRCFTIGLTIYGIGALHERAVARVSACSSSGNSILEGVGTALLIPPVYILTTMLFTDITRGHGRSV